MESSGGRIPVEGGSFILIGATMMVAAFPAKRRPFCTSHESHGPSLCRVLEVWWNRVEAVCLRRPIKRFGHADLRPMSACLFGDICYLLSFPNRPVFDPLRSENRSFRKIPASVTVAQQFLALLVHVRIVGGEMGCSRICFQTGLKFGWV